LCGPGCRVMREHAHPLERDRPEGGFGQAKKGAKRVAQAADLHVGDRDTADMRRARADRRGGAVLDPGRVAVGVAEIVPVGGEGGLHALHRDVVKADLLDLAATAAAGLDP